MGWSRRNFLGVSLVTAAYPYGKLLAAPRNPSAELVLDFEDAGGSVTNTGTKNNKAYTSAVNYLSHRGGGTLAIPQKVYPFDGAAACSAVNVTVSGYGATFAGNGCGLSLGVKSNGYNIEGLTLIDTSGSASTFLFDCYGSGCHFKDVHLEKNPPAKGYIGYCRDGTSGMIFENLSFAGANGIYLAGHDHQIIGGSGDSFGGDDCWALKAPTNPCYNIQISGFQARGFAAIFSIGSEIGSLQQDDPSHSRYVRNVLVQNCSAQDCTYLAYIKPGAIPTIDYRDGLVEDISVLGCQIQDSSGNRFRNGVFVSPGKGAIVRSLTIKDIAISARGVTPAVQTVSAVYLYALSTTNGAGVGASIGNISIANVQCTDPFGGAATAASTPGTPIHSLIAIEKQNPGIGHIGQVDVSGSTIDGCARMAVSVGSQVSGPVSVNDCTLSNYAAAIYSSMDKGSVLARSPINLTGITAVPSPTAPSDTRGVLPDACPDKTVQYTGDSSQISIPSVDAGSDLSVAIYSNARDSWISRVEVAVDQAIAASQTDFVRFTVRNGGNGNVLGTATTSSGFLSLAGAPASINGDIQFSGLAAYLPKSSELILEIVHGGQGATLLNPVVVVHSVPYGIS